MFSLVELFNICANGKDYTTVSPANKKYEVDYKFVEDEEEKTLYIFFEPSDGKTDWVVNFSYWRKPYKDMEIGYRVHGGFLSSWKLIRDTVTARVIEKDAEGNFRWKRVVCVGYSHGGALAALCHECVWFERPDLRDSADALQGYSFEGPRVYAGLWVNKDLQERWRNFTTFFNHNDIVPHLPPVLFFFRHVGKKTAKVLSEYYNNIDNIDNIEKFKRGELYDSYDFFKSNCEKLNFDGRFDEFEINISYKK